MEKPNYKNVDAYIAAQPDKMRPLLEELRQTIKKAAPKAEEIISYQMPGYKYNGLLVWFAGAKNHIGLYPTPKTIQVFKDKLSKYELSKGTIRFPLDKTLPLNLVKEIVKYRIKENTEKALLKKSKNKKT